MRTIGIEELSENTAEIIREAAGGAVITVLDRGRPVVDLVPHRMSKIEQLLAQGLINRVPKPQTETALAQYSTFSGAGADLDSEIKGLESDFVC
jgi:prevent-host-death family protein